MNKPSIETRVLTSLLKNRNYCQNRRCSSCETYRTCEIIKASKRLIKAGVKVSTHLNYNVGDIVYMVIPYVHKVHKCIITSISLINDPASKNKKKKLIQLEYTGNKVVTVTENDLNKTVFFCEEDAQEIISLWKSNGLR